MNNWAMDASRGIEEKWLSCFFLLLKKLNKSCRTVDIDTNTTSLRNVLVLDFFGLWLSLPASPSPCMSEVHNVRLSLSSCMMSVESLYDSSERVSNSAMAPSKAAFANRHARSGELRIS